MENNEIEHEDEEIQEEELHKKEEIEKLDEPLTTLEKENLNNDFFEQKDTFSEEASDFATDAQLSLKRLIANPVH